MSKKLFVEEWKMSIVEYVHVLFPINSHLITLTFAFLQLKRRVHVSHVPKKRLKAKTNAAAQHSNVNMIYEICTILLLSPSLVKDKSLWALQGV